MEDVKHEMYAHDPPELLDDIIDLAIRLDSRMELRCRVRENTSWSRAELSVPSPAPHVSELPDPEPMQVGRMRLTVEEKQRRLSKGFCLHCGGQGHIAAKCPLKANACQYIGEFWRAVLQSLHQLVLILSFLFQCC